MTREASALHKATDQTEFVQASTAAGQPAVSIRNLSLRLGESFDLKVPDIDVMRNDRVAVVGHNGAGKSCLLECLVGLQYSAAGQLRVLGHTPLEMDKHPQLRRHMGVQLQRNNFPETVPVRDLVDFHRALFGPGDTELSSILDMSSLRRLSYGVLSRGQKQRVDLYMALAHKPPLIILDEPTAGLDANFTDRVVRLIGRLQQSTIIMASHIDVELAAATKLLLLGDGKVLAYGASDDIVHSTVGSYKIELEYADVTSAEVCEAKLRSNGCVRRLSRPDPLRVSAYGDAPLESVLLPFQSAAISYSAGRSTLADFLAITSTLS